MKTIGLIGGMSWESSQLYYELVNKKVKSILGGFHSAKSIMVSVDFDEIVRLQSEDDWVSLNSLMVKAARQLEDAGADMILVCANTMHLCSKEIIENTNLPFVHIAEATQRNLTAERMLISKLLIYHSEDTSCKPAWMDDTINFFY